ncbi:MAG: gamma-glutamylcyclotransferase [Burkholderiaceae bacterium]
MTKSDDPYRHHPELRDKIADPLTSRFRQIDLSVVDKKMIEAGMPADWRVSDEAREASRAKTLSQHPANEDLWLFGYGSLIWDPGFHFSEVRVATLEGYQRRFCLRSELGRGSPASPGVMVGLDVGGHCQSLAFKIPASLVHEETRLIWKREMLRRTYQPQFVTLSTAHGNVQALTFIVDPGCTPYMPDMPIEQVAHYVATGAGIYGTSFEYVDNLVIHLEGLGIVDPAVTELHTRARQLRED